MTEESKQMDRELKEQSPNPSLQSHPRFVQQFLLARQVPMSPTAFRAFSSIRTLLLFQAQSLQRSQPKGPPKTVRKRAVKQSEPEEQPQPKQAARETYSEPEEEFSDFSF